MDHQQLGKLFPFVSQLKKLFEIFFLVWYCRSHKHLKTLVIRITHCALNLKPKSLLSRNQCHKNDVKEK